MICTARLQVQMAAISCWNLLNLLTFMDIFRCRMGFLFHCPPRSEDQKCTRKSYLTKHVACSGKPLVIRILVSLGSALVLLLSCLVLISSVLRIF